MRPRPAAQRPGSPSGTQAQSSVTPPILGAPAAAHGVANPLPQALILTAIVIGFGLVTFMIVLVWRALGASGIDDSDAMRLAEPDLPPTAPADY